ncbi:MAG: response regulator, partial [Caulobacterales bacterium]|nr:response regulator [Caulobacterales bacterium]
MDDSAVVRGLLSRWVEEADDIEIVAMAKDGQQGVDAARAHQPDVIVLDVEMPRMNGLEALPLIREAAPGAKVVMASTLTHRNADITLKALA